ncbi:MAG: hypothetical protein MUF46_03900 [Desulfobacterales bacterium]|jgi:hypothetical protein|nr:hypothetical protein [Desulfobacterales bacterium]
MDGTIRTKWKKCCAREHERLAAELETCDRLAAAPSKWHRCARLISRRSSRRARDCMLQS